MNANSKRTIQMFQFLIPRVSSILVNTGPFSIANYHTLDGRRSRTYSESKGHVSAEIDGLLDDLNRMRNHENFSNRMTRWSSLGTVLGDGGHYSTTLTRRHMKRSREPIDVYFKKPVSFPESFQIQFNMLTEIA